MPCRCFLRCSAPLLLAFSFSCFLQGQGAEPRNPQTLVQDSHTDHVKQRNEWFYRGRVVRGMNSAELRRRAHHSKLRLRRQRAAAEASGENGPDSLSSGSWTPLGPVPLASDASGNGTQDYHQVAGRATAIAIDPADSTGNTIYIGGAQAGIWKSTNAANPTANNVAWTPISDEQATLSIGAIAIQPGNTDPAKTVILAATGEADSSSDSYFGLGILRSSDAGNTWTLLSTANNGALSFGGLGGTRMAFSTASRKTVVAAMATSSEGLVDGAVTTGTTRGLYTSLDAGQSWTYNALTDPGGATDATSATSVAYNASAGMFFAAIRYHGFYSSPDGFNWTRLANQPGGSALSTAACPPTSTSNNRACPIYRGEITVVPTRNEMYVWYISFSPSGTPGDGGIWESTNGGASWTSIADTSISNCGDSFGCGVQQGSYNLALLAVPNGTATDLYAGAVNLYKCSLNSQNSTCASVPFLNLTHVYGCDPIAAPAHVHPDQHALAYTIPASGTDLLYFANDGGIYRALDGFSGLNSGACSGTNAFDDLNQNLGSMTQFVSFSQHPADADTMFGGAQDNGSPATGQATTNSSWTNVLGGDGGYNAIDPVNPTDWYASNPDVPPAGLGVQLCSSGVNCTNSGFSFVATSNTLGGDDGAFYFPYILDPSSSSAMLIGTCRVWRGPRDGGAFIALGPNFDTLGSAICSGSEVNTVRALAAAGATDINGSTIVYATTSGLGPLDGPLTTPSGGRVWVTTNASGGVPSFADVTNNGPQGSINPNQFPISGVATDSSDTTGSTAYVTVMGFTGGLGHVWKTTNAGATWTDFTANLPDSPVNAVVVYALSAEVFVATDVGVFGSSTSVPSWTELGPNPNSNQAGFLPNVAVTALGIFNSGGQQLLRASTYGRGIWQFNLVNTPDFQFSISNSPLTNFAGAATAFLGTITALNGYNNEVTLSCAAGTTAPPTTCTPSPAVLTPGKNTPFTVDVNSGAGDYSFNVQAVGFDSAQITHTVPVTLHLLSFGITTPNPANVTVPRGTSSSPVSFQVTAAGSFNQPVTVSCTTTIPLATCTLTPSATVTPTADSPVNMTASVSVPAGSSAGTYTVTLQASTAGAPSSLTTAFTLVVTSNPDFALTEPGAFPEIIAGTTGSTGPISIASLDSFAGTVSLTCPNTFGAGSCSISPTSVSSFPATATLTVNGASFSAGGYSLVISGTSGSTVHTLAVPFNVGDYSITGTQTLSANPGAQATANLTLSSLSSYAGSINSTCDASSLVGAMCTLTPSTSINLASGATAPLTASINTPNNASAGVFVIKVNTTDSTGVLSHTANISLTILQDFLLTSSTSSQTVTAGQTSGPYALTVQPVGAAFNAAVTLACTGLPPGASCIFNPSAPVTPGASAADVVMSIATQAKAGSQGRRSSSVLLSGLLLLVPLIAAGGFRSRATRRLRVCSISGVMILLALLPSCAGVSSGGGGNPPPPVTYHVTITGSSPGTPPDAGQVTVVTLVVN